MSLAEADRHASSVDVNPDRHITYLVAKVSNRLQRELDRALQAVGLTLIQFSALAHIARRPDLSNADLARALLTSPQATTTLVSRLVKHGLVQRTTPSRGKVSAVRLSEAGMRKLEAAERIAVAAEQRAWRSVPARQQDNISVALERLLADLEQAPFPH